MRKTVHIWHTTCMNKERYTNAALLHQTWTILMFTRKRAGGQYCFSYCHLFLQNILPVLFCKGPTSYITYYDPCSPLYVTSSHQDTCLNLISLKI